jgi:hypothetical protein
MTREDLYREVLEQVREAFSMMPYLHGAIPANIRDVRQEVNAALDSFLPALNAALEDEVYLVRDGDYLDDETGQP